MTFYVNLLYVFPPNSTFQDPFAVIFDIIRCISSRSCLTFMLSRYYRTRMLLQQLVLCTMSGNTKIVLLLLQVLPPSRLDKLQRKTMSCKLLPKTGRIDSVPATFSSVTSANFQTIVVGPLTRDSFPVQYSYENQSYEARSY